MRRRQFLGLAGGSMLVWPLATRAQQAALPVIGFLHSSSPEQNQRRLDAFLKGLREAGFVDGQNVTIAYRWADGHNERLADLAADLVRSKVTLIATSGSTAAAMAAKNATTTIPVVFSSGSDPVELGLVASLNRPGGNVTGVTSVNADISAKRLGVLRELTPRATRYFMLLNPASPLAQPFNRDLQAGALSLGLHIDVLNGSSDAEIEAAFAGLPQQPGLALISSPDAFLYSRRARLAELTASHAMPAIFDVRDYVDAGALVSYGADYLGVMQLVGSYTGRVLRGEKPADLPVVQPQKFELVINLKTAGTLGIAVPPTLLATADEVIE
jgi:putative ABC transport system substrate-binding protein